MRAECQDVETGLSYLRRVVQGRLDIVGAELTRRRERRRARPTSPALIEQLPDDPRRPPAGARQRPAAHHRSTPASIDPELEARLDAMVVDGLDDLAALDDDGARPPAEALADLEHDDLRPSARRCSTASTPSRPSSPAATAPARPPWSRCCT